MSNTLSKFLAMHENPTYAPPPRHRGHAIPCRATMIRIAKRKLEKNPDLIRNGPDPHEQIQHHDSRAQKLAITPFAIAQVTQPDNCVLSYNEGKLDQPEIANIDFKHLTADDRIRIINFLEEQEQKKNGSTCTGLVYQTSFTRPKYKYVYSIRYDKDKSVLYIKTTTIGLNTLFNDMCIDFSGMKPIGLIELSKYREIKTRLKRAPNKVKDSVKEFGDLSL